MQNNARWLKLEVDDCSSCVRDAVSLGYCRASAWTNPTGATGSRSRCARRAGKAARSRASSSQSALPPCRQTLAKSVDPTLELEEEAQQVLQDIAEDFVENVAAFACELVKHREGNTLEAKDLQLALGALLPHV